MGGFHLPFIFQGETEPVIVPKTIPKLAIWHRTHRYNTRQNSLPTVGLVDSKGETRLNYLFLGGKEGVMFFFSTSECISILPVWSAWEILNYVGTLGK